MKYSYRKTLKCRYDYDYYETIPEDRETFFSFQQWVILFEADKKNWSFYENKDHKVIMPYYEIATTETKKEKYPCFETKTKKERYYIKFLTRKDFKKFIKYINKMFKEGRNYTNIKEQEFLISYIRNENEKELKKIQEELTAMIEEKKSSLYLETGDKIYEFPYE